MRKAAKPVYAADFETTTNPEDCRVWAWGICNIKETENVHYGIDIQSFIEYISDLNAKIYFHNLKFDGRFIVDYLLRNGWEWMDTGDYKSPVELKPHTFTSLISNMGVWYSLQLRFPDGPGGKIRKVDIFDSYKIITMPIKKMPKTFGIDALKGDLDYKGEREVGHRLTDEEIKYLHNDVYILAKALDYMLSHGQTKMTAGSNAFADYKKRITPKAFKRLFPIVDDFSDADIRKSYKGGWSYLNPAYKNIVVGAGQVYDVNSMYPSVLKQKLMPYGEPIWFNGEYKPDPMYPLYVVNFLCQFKIKPNHYPSIQIKGAPMRYIENEYLTESDGPTWITLTNIDLELMLDQYDVDVLEWNGGYMFHGQTGMFDDYIDYWYGIKSESKHEGNHGMEAIAKLMLNSLYGKFGTRKQAIKYIPYLDEEKNLVRYREGEPERVEKGYIPVATFCTSYARDKIIRGAQACGERFIYADTDSLHVLGTEPIEGLDIDEYRLGAFKVENTFTRAKFLRQKTYLEVFIGPNGEERKIKCAGMPDELKAKIREDEFAVGQSWGIEWGNLKSRSVPGGVVLKETPFTIKG